MAQVSTAASPQGGSPGASGTAGSPVSGKGSSPASGGSPHAGHGPAGAGAHLEDILAENQVQVDEGFDDAASLESASFVTSLNSSIFNYKYENGRRYHAFREGSYLVPNDDEEQNRMDLVHHIYRLMLGGKLHLAPLDNNVHRVLDLGTGTGIWAIDFADEYPSAEVVGTDLSPIQPKWTPPNCVFEVDDFESEWTFRRPFDFVFGRELEGCIADEDLLFQRAFAHLRPGGVLEMQAVYPQFRSDDDTAQLAESANRWMGLMWETAVRFGKPWDVASRWEAKMAAAGFVDVHQEIHKLPIGGWPKDPKLKELGKCQLFQELQAVDAYTPGLLSRVLGWKQDEIEIFLARVRTDIKNPAIHTYLPVYFVWARKPASASE